MAELFGAPNEKTWGIVLNKDNKTVVWPSESDLIDGTDMKLELSQATLGINVKAGERNIVELSIVTEFGTEGTQTFPIVSLKEGLSEHTLLNLSLNPPVSFSLTSGSGPISIMGVQHNMAGEDSSGSEDDSDNEELVNKETIGPGKKRKFGSPVTDAKKSKLDIKTEAKPPVLPAGNKDKPESMESTKEKIMKMMGKDGDDDDDSDDDSNVDLEDSLSDEEGKNGLSLDDDSMSDASVEKKVETIQPTAKKVKSKPAKAKPTGKTQQEQKATPKGAKAVKIQAQAMEAVKAKLRANKSLPKSEEKFKNYIKTLKVSDGGQISDLWKFVQTIRKP